ncbi:hypothetical protein R1sor_026756 [Riccia sorocarpa]|uniref:GS catalytic domain-containing protein n=1 Tax=Riccia sorocarpa TaxID=122646 RepID=A0ABD3GCZ8_9MARC
MILPQHSWTCLCFSVLTGEGLVDDRESVAYPVGEQEYHRLDLHKIAGAGNDFGDEDLDLQLANPLLLRSVLEDPEFERARIVFLHASYPYMRQAAYLSSIYPQVYLDFGLAIPKLSKRGMKAAVAELLELAPINKVMFSTDACGFPESYYLGAKLARTIVADVLCDSVEDGDLTLNEAIEAAQNMLRSNSLSFYKLKGGVSGKKAKTVTQRSGKQEEPSWSCLNNTKYVRLMWVDPSGQRRCKVVPTERFKNGIFKKGISLAQCVMATSSHTGWPSPRLWFNSDRRNATRSRFVDVNSSAAMGVRAGFEAEFYLLRRLPELSPSAKEIMCKCGFISPLTWLSSVSQDRRSGKVWTSLRTASTFGLNQSLRTLDCMLKWLKEMHINVEQFHAEAGGGQFEIILAHEPVLKAADSLLLAREAITAAAISQNLHATFLPKLNLKNTAFGSGCHVHISLSKGGKNVFTAESGADSVYGMSETGASFLAGVLEHLPAVLAFTAPHPNSYKRIQPRTWSGAYQCWGVENKEAPLRACRDLGVITNVELKAFDGCANPHLGLAAVIAAGLDGLRRKLQLPPPVNVDPAELDKENQVKRLPTTAAEAAQSLEDDETMRQLMGEKLVKNFLAIRRSEEEFYLRGSMENLIYKY